MRKNISHSAVLESVLSGKKTDPDTVSGRVASELMPLVRVIVNAFELLFQHWYLKYC